MSKRQSVIRAATLLTACLSGGTAWSEEVRLTIKDSPQPLATAAKRLETREGWGITYEEPLGALPAANSLDLTYTVTEATRTDVKLQEEVLTRLLAQQAGKDAPRFRLVRAGELWHITPVQGSPLDTPITMPRQERSLGEVLRALCAEVTRQSGTRVELGSAPGLKLEAHITVDAVTQEPARTVLERVLNSANRRTVWTLSSQGTKAGYQLSLHRVFRLFGGTLPPPTPAPSENVPAPERSASGG